MKKLFVLIVFVFASSGLYAQHYGGISFTPYAVENFSSYKTWYPSYYNTEDNKTTFGYTIGYQGLLMPQNRFSFSYGLQYASSYNEITYKAPQRYTENGQLIRTGTGERLDLQAIEIPLWWRYNIFKNRKKWQPFIALSTTLNFPLEQQRTFYYSDNSPVVYNNKNNFSINLDLGVGVNYYADNWLFTVQPTLSSGYVRKLGVNFSVMKKF